MSILKIAGFVSLPFIGSGLSSIFPERKFKPIPSSTGIQIREWYDTKVVKPWFSPPNWIFPIVWTYLYGSSGYASYLIYENGVGKSRDVAMAIYGTSLIFNWAFSIVFFKNHNFFLGFLDCVLLSLSVAGCVWSFYPIDKIASYLMIPYLGWGLFASIISLNLWKNNKNLKDE